MEDDYVTAKALPAVTNGQGGSVMMEAEVARKVQEVQAALIIARNNPRDEVQAYTKIMEACQRPGLAEQAVYSFPRGATTVSGPSIRLAEVLARNWKHVHIEVTEVSQSDDYSEVMSKAWDLENNFCSVKTFRVSHWRHTRKDKTKLTDPRDIYEKVANEGARRLRACILAVIPGDIVEDAVKACEKTLAAANSDKPIKDRIREMLVIFSKEHQVTQAMIEKRLGHTVEVITEHELVTLRGIFKALRDNMAQRESYFDVTAAGGALPAASEEPKPAAQSTPAANTATSEAVKPEPPKEEKPKDGRRRSNAKDKEAKAEDPKSATAATDKTNITVSAATDQESSIAQNTAPATTDNSDAAADALLGTPPPLPSADSSEGPDLSWFSNG